MPNPRLLLRRKLAVTHRDAVRHDVLEVSAGFLRLMDLAIVPASALIAYALRFGSASVTYTDALVVPLSMLFLGNAMSVLKAYDLSELGSFRQQVTKVAGGWGATLAVLTLLAFFEKVGEHYARLWIGLWFCIGPALSLATRWGLATYLDMRRRAGTLSVRVAVVGDAPFAKDVARRISSLNNIDVSVIGIFEPRLGVSDGENLSVEDLMRLAHQSPIDEIIVQLPATRGPEYHAILQKLQELPVNVDLYPDLSDLPIVPQKFAMLRDAVMINAYERPLRAWPAVLKRAEDLALGGVLTLFCLPLIGVIALLTKLTSRGPIFFRQPRTGYRNQPFTILKFRTMYIEQTDLHAERLVGKGDPRVTPLGAFLRRSSLDELPQLFNVLAGQMSLVGPRPHAAQAKAGDMLYAAAVEEYGSRFRVKPGITGWAQVNGWRGPTNTVEQIRQRVAHDLDYINNWSLLLDLRILARTVMTIFKADNAC